MKAKIYTDGASRGNPGEAGIGYVILMDSSEITGKAYIGKTTNNVAEYMAMIEALKKALSIGVRNVEIYTDSELMVKQLKGEYKVKAPHLRNLHTQVLELLKKFEEALIYHIDRKDNRKADRLANEAIDEALGEAGRSLPG